MRIFQGDQDFAMRSIPNKEIMMIHLRIILGDLYLSISWHKTSSKID